MYHDPADLRSVLGWQPLEIDRLTREVRLQQPDAAGHRAADGDPCTLGMMHLEGS
jgi:hypothetical protein